MSGGDRDDAVNGEAGNDGVHGDAGNDDLSGATAPGAGEPGDDQLFGGDGNDNVVDCINRNVLDAGPGQDLCEFDPTQSSAANGETFVTCP